MVEELEKAQKALRDMDYDSVSEDGDGDDREAAGLRSGGTATAASPPRARPLDRSHPSSHLPSPDVSPASASTLERFLSSEDDHGKDARGEPFRSGAAGPPGQPSFGAPAALSIEMPQAKASPAADPNAAPPALPSSSTSKLYTKIPAPNSLFDDDDSMAAVELQTFGNGAGDGVVDVDMDMDVNMDVNMDTNGNASGNFIGNFIGNASGNHETNPYAENDRTHASTHQPGTAGYLEMEEEPPRSVHHERNGRNSVVVGESIKTDSGLVLTHRKIAAAAASSFSATHRNQQKKQQHRHRAHDDNPLPQQRVFRETQQDYFEAENGIFRGWNRENPTFRQRKEGGNHFGGYSGSLAGGFGSGTSGRNSMVVVQAKRLLSYVRIWVVLFSLIALSMTGVFFHSLGRQDDPKSLVTKTDAALSSSSSPNSIEAGAAVLLPDPAVEKILLLPLPGISERGSLPVRQQQHQQTQQQAQQHFQPYHPRRLQMLRDRDGNRSGDPDDTDNRFIPHLRREFERWMRQHSKAYHSDEEKERRFSIWSQNHERTAEKNRRHGPCTLTKQHVFGSNHFKDLAPEEFRAKFLTGYKGAHADVLEEKLGAMSPGERKLRKDAGIGVVLDPKLHKVDYHESVLRKQRHLKQETSSYKPKVMTASAMYCKWYDASCILRYIWLSTGIQFGMIGTMEPKFDADAFPNSVDWRDSGAVTYVRTQGECGACWAITAVETVESAYFLATGTLYTLSESEIIVCDDSCEMCSGGWPQNAFEWVMDHGGLPLQNTLPYDSYTLIALTAGAEGDSEYYSEEALESYRNQVCPASDAGSHDGSGSNDESYWGNGAENKNYADYSDQGRYGNIRGYGYATDRCLCYTDGSGCDCDDQDEDTAVRNIATYGPAVVCLEASTWQDYSGGIMTDEIGCGHEFSDMNHCVQVVGYAFTDDSDCGEGDAGDEGEGKDANCGGGSNDGSGSGSNSGSSDSREGYWIVRNQWGSSWGMNGYAYVAMGGNTCGILNDMTVAYA